MRNKLLILICFFLILPYSLIFGQKLVNSPYSRFNLGTLEPAGSVRNLGMGGVETPLRNNLSVSYSNPASFSSLDTNSFIFDFGVDYSVNRLSNDELKYNSEDINFDHLIMGFPLSKGWGVALGIIPYSNGYYKISETIAEGNPEYDPLTGEYTSFHKGTGNYTNFFIGTGVKITRNISAGLNVTLLLGQIQRFNQFSFSDLYNVFHDNSTEKHHLSGINLSYGIQYSGSLSDDRFLNVGVSLSTGKNFNSKYEHVLYRHSAYGSSSSDTIVYIMNDTASTFIPGTFRAGIAFGKKDLFTAGIDYVSTRWSKMRIPGSDGYSADTRSILFGVEYIPEKYSNYSYLKRIEYRFGAHIDENYLIIDGEQIKQFGLTLGFGLPMLRSLSKTNIFFDITRKNGITDGYLQHEDYFTCGVSITLHANWFVKRKYD